uniref:Uncharacterized protein n=1 Tax=Oryza sativa subsp. japonica TaxID=39947 RepID=Q69XY6_ORYSJ|nr:hypothetical protein [Oryza sativa Japonica Group]
MAPRRISAHRRSHVLASVAIPSVGPLAVPSTAIPGASTGGPTTIVNAVVTSDGRRRPCWRADGGAALANKGTRRPCWRAVAGGWCRRHRQRCHRMQEDTVALALLESCICDQCNPQPLLNSHRQIKAPPSPVALEIFAHN